MINAESYTQEPGLPRLTLFAKGNVDLHDSLHSCRIAGQLRWNGINEVVRDRFPGQTVRVIHETCTRWDAALAATGSIPPEVDRPLPLGVYPLKHQFSEMLYKSQPDAFVLSVQPDIATGLYKHKATGELLYPHAFPAWSEADRSWLLREFEHSPPPDVDTSMRHLAAVVARIRSLSEMPILVYNLSSFVPGEIVHSYQGMGETFTRRARRFNVALTDLCEVAGLCLVDVETIVGRAGADRLKQDALHLTPEGHQRVAEEVVRILEDLGLLQQGEMD